VEYLARIAGTDSMELGTTLLERGMDLSGTPPGGILTRDVKEFELSKKKVIIAQVMVPSFAWNRGRSPAIQEELASLRHSTRADLAIALFTSVMENASDLYGAADEPLIRALFGDGLPVRMAGVMSRKKDFLPWLGDRLRELS
jgi:manganese-dependent inorganic pyrophosphatase